MGEEKEDSGWRRKERNSASGAKEWRGVPNLKCNNVLLCISTLTEEKRERGLYSKKQALQMHS